MLSGQAPTFLEPSGEPTGQLAYRVFTFSEMQPSPHLRGGVGHGCVPARWIFVCSKRAPLSLRATGSKTRSPSNWKFCSVLPKPSGGP